MESPKMSANCKECGEEYWTGTLDNYQDLMDIMHARGGYYCEAHKK